MVEKAQILLSAFLLSSETNRSRMRKRNRALRMCTRGPHVEAQPRFTHAWALQQVVHKEHAYIVSGRI
jgi:hypothetical protein